MISRFLVSSSFFSGSSACVCCDDASPLVENDSGSGFVFASASVDTHLPSKRSESGFADGEDNGSRCRDRKGEWSWDIEREGR